MPKLPNGVSHLDYVKCPSCGYIGDIVSFDVLLACEGCLYCLRCDTEFDSVSGQIHEEAECCVEVVYTPQERQAGEYVEYCTKMEDVV